MRKAYRLAPVMAVLLSLLTAQGTVFAGATWSAPVSIWSPDNANEAVDATGLVALDNGVVAVAYTERLSTGTHNVYVRRSIDGGVSWMAPVQVSLSGSNGQTYRLGGISGYGSNVDVVWWEPVSGGNARVKYARSTDSGQSFSTPVALTKLDRIWVPTVARGPDGVVAVVWLNRTSAKIFVRVSHNGGQTFAARQELWGHAGGYAVAVADGTIYVANSRADGIQIRRSLDGFHWGRRTQVTSYPTDVDFPWPVSLTAEGDRALVGFIRYTKNGEFVPSYRQTLNKGANWSSRMRLSAPYPEGKLMLLPLMSLRDGVVRTVFGWGDILYRESADGVAWTTAEVCCADGLHGAIGVAFTDRVVVAYADGPNHVQARTRTP